MKNSNVADRQQCFSVEEAEELTGGIKKWQVSTWGARLEEPEKYQEMLYGAAYAKAMAEKNRTATKWTGDPESYTPAKYIEAARQVMGGIDLDPASNTHAQQIVKATKWHGVNEDGLLQAWHGRVFLNPPYAYPTVGHFIDKPNTTSGSVVETLLRGLPDEVLIEECERRGLKVEATDA